MIPGTENVTSTTLRVHRTTFTYDNVSNIIRIDRPNANWEAKAYDAVNRVIRDTVSFTDNLETWFTDRPSGTLHTMTDPRGTVGRTYPNGDANFTTAFLSMSRTRERQCRILQ